jgi:hypothetical protein
MTHALGSKQSWGRAGKGARARDMEKLAARHIRTAVFVRALFILRKVFMRFEGE